MPKLKTRKTVSKRIKVSALGKMRRKHSQTSHLRSKERSSTQHRKRRLVSFSHGDARRIRKQLPYI